MSRADRSRAERSRVEQSRVEQSGVEQSGLEQNRVEQSGVEQSEVEQSGVQQCGVQQSGVQQSGAEQSGAEWREQECISIESVVQKRKESGHSCDISQECEGRECKSKLKCKWIDKTQREFRTMQKVLGEYKEENRDERLGEIESFYSVFA